MQLDWSGTSVGEKCRDFYVLGDKLYTVNSVFDPIWVEKRKVSRMTPNFCACAGK